ncbi:MAG TPA: hypothetical protein VGG37_06125, partial [Opitutaceae bacterium]
MDSGLNAPDLAEVRRKAYSFADAQVYSLQNEYTTVAEKLEIECWHQLPSLCASYAFLTFNLISPNRPWWSYGFANGIDLAITMLCWFAYSRAWVVPVFIKLRHWAPLWGLHIAGAIWLFMHSKILIGVLVLAGPLFGA